MSNISPLIDLKPHQSSHVIRQSLSGVNVLPWRAVVCSHAHSNFQH